MRTETLYSRADWKYHKDRLGYDDVIDRNGRLVATVNVMDIAAGEMFQKSYLDGGPPKEIFMREADGCWSIYLSVPWLTPARVQAALTRLGSLLGHAFVFDPYRLPAKLTARYRHEASALNERTKDTAAMSAAPIRAGARSAQPRQPPSPNSKRLATLISQKLKV